MRKAVGVLKELSADEVTRMLFEKREMARRDFESMMEKARRDAEMVRREAEMVRREAEMVRREAEMARREAETERHKWQGVVADKDAEIARLRAQLEKQNGESK